MIISEDGSTTSVISLYPHDSDEKVYLSQLNKIMFVIYKGDNYGFEGLKLDRDTR